MADAGFHAVAPDMRGYGGSDRPHEIDQYTLLHLVGDMVGLVDALGEKSAVIAGHDWGAPVAWHAALLRPDRFPAVIGLSVNPPNTVSPNLVLGANAPDRALGELRCEGRGAVIINVDGRDYAVNGMAGPRYPPIQTLWNKESQPQADIDRLIVQGLTLCAW